jgi:hypothetical protein
MHKIKNYFKLGGQILSRLTIHYQDDTWVGAEPLYARFPTIFDKSSDLDLQIRQAYSKTGWRIHFCRNFGPEDDQLFQEMSNLVDNISLEDEPHKVSWSLEPSDTFSTKSLYQALCSGPEVQLTEYL